MQQVKNLLAPPSVNQGKSFSSDAQVLRNHLVGIPK
jgi:hypothetical protein